MIVKLLTEHHLEFLSLKGGLLVAHTTLLEISCTGSISMAICSAGNHCYDSNR